MKKKSTLFERIHSKTTLIKGLIFTFVISSLFFAGCYEWSLIIQPESAPINSYFDPLLVAKDDGNPDNDWTNPDLHDIGLFGVMIPSGWSVQDSVPYTVICTDPSYNNSGILVYSAARSQTLQDSIPAAPGYFWWGSETDGEASLIYLDSLYITPRIFVGSAAGAFFVRYAIGDVNYWDRNPADDLSAPIPITIYDPVGLDEMLSEANIRFYPNPVSNKLTIEFKQYRQQVVDMGIFNLNGQMIKHEKLLHSATTINLEGVETGIYFVRLRNGKSTETHKIIIH